MPCNTQLSRRGSRRRRGTGFWDRDQTISERKQEVREVVKTLDGYLVRGLAKVIIGPQGGVTFTGFPDAERDGVTDNCAYRLLMSTGSSLAKAAIARAEAMSGRSINKQAIAAGLHSHDGGHSWHGKG